jgi:repressor LexA
MFLTRRQQEILDFVQRFTAKWGYAPSLEEVQHQFRLASPSTVHKHLKNLQAKGVLRREPNRSRGLEVLETEAPALEGSVDLPLLGTVSAGRPIEAVEQPDTIAVPQGMLGRRGRTYVLKVKGDSMIEDCIQDGDFVIVEERTDARNGEMVIACLGEGDVTLKRYYREIGQVRLQPANAAYEPIYVRDGEFRIQGIVIGILRKY